ncbi:MAG: PIN domain-containing protein [Holophagaceae bacterium]|nr:PIN domain-containing protein [Holophagaceae bacterium]
MKFYTFDSCALIAVIFKSQGHETIKKILKKVEDDRAKIIMHKVNLLESIKVISKKRSPEDAKMAYEYAIESPIIFFDTIDLPFCTEFAKISQQFGTYFADTFVATTNAIHTHNKGTIVTSDKGFDKISETGYAKIEYFN